MNIFSLIRQHIQELIRYRSLVNSLVVRELKARYRGSFFGFLWTFLNPLLLLAVYALVFNYYLRIQVEHYAGFMFVGLLPWIWFSSSLLEGTISITAGGSLVTKVIFPSQILPAVKILANLANYLLSLPILFGFLWVMGVYQGWPLLWLPLILCLHLLFIEGLVLLLAAINVFFRDVQHILSNLLTLGFFLTPILYPLSQVPAPFNRWILFSPLAQITLAYQDVFFYNRNPNFWVLSAFLVASLLLLGIGMFFFEHYKETFAEKV
jgi:lipopolysaccharide transport system permease protein